MVRVRIAARGRAMARRLMLDPSLVYDYWFSTESDVTSHHLLARDGLRILPPSLVPALEYL